jgi:hypothetical protein
MGWQVKIAGTGLRWRHAVVWWPRRWRRLGRHLLQFCWFKGRWWLEFMYLLLDLLAFPEIYETLADWIKWRSRPLSREERALLYPLFGDSLAYDRVRIDERAFVGPPQWRICYVSFYTINAWGPMSPDLLIHEAVHIWQFTQWGSVYIPRALRAQRSEEGYNYGGAPRVSSWARRGARLEDFNPEQQADLVADYWRLSRGLPLQWGPAGPLDSPFYRYFVDQLADKG